MHGGGCETGFARISVHVRSAGDLGSWEGDICSASYQATSATLIVLLTPFFQKLSTLAAAGSPTKQKCTPLLPPSLAFLSCRKQ